MDIQQFQVVYSVLPSGILHIDNGLVILPLDE